MSTLQELFQSCCLPQVFAASVGIVLTLALILHWYGTRSFAILKKLSIPGHKPHAFVGNLPDIKRAGGLLAFEMECMKKYGKVFSVCLGRQVTIVVADPEILKEIMVKEFSNFVNRFPVLSFAKVPPFHLMMSAARDEIWKRIRNTLTSSFTAAKLKKLMDHMERAVGTLEGKLLGVADTGKSVDMKEWFSRMTLEVILSAAFGVQSTLQTDKDSVMVDQAKAVFQPPQAFSQFLVSLPFGAWLAKLKNSAGLPYWYSLASGIIKTRRQEAEKGIMGRTDLVHLMLTAHEEPGPEGKCSKLSNEEIVAQSVVFLLAGTETSSNALAFTIYLLALYPDIQTKLRSEVETVIEENGEKPLVVNNIEYFDCVMNESLRLYPPAFNMNRECKQSCSINGVYFPAGVEIMIPFYVLHNDPDAWPDVSKFDPERFRTPNRGTIHPFQIGPTDFMPFGAGPRICIAMRFALVEIKLTLVKLLTKYRFLRSPETQVPLALHDGASLTARDGVHVRVESIG